MGKHSSRRQRRRRLLAGGGGAALALAGAGAVGVALTSQRHPPQPLPAQAGTTTASRPAPPARGEGPAAAVAGVIARLESALDPLALPPARPVLLTIPAIGVRTRLGEVGRTPSGAVAAPPLYARPSEAAWFRFSASPGARGAAIIVGHVDDYAGPAVFFQLGAVRPGAQVTVRRSDGTVAVFRVDGVRRYAKAHFPSRLVYGSSATPTLRLITCGGPFDGATRRYVDNVVVFASLVGVRM